MMINRRNTKEEEDECCSRQPLKLRTATVSLLSVVCLVVVLGSSAITGALAQQSKTAYDGAADEDLQVNTFYTVFIFTHIEKEKEGVSLGPCILYLFMGCYVIFHFYRLYFVSAFDCKMRRKSDAFLPGTG